MLPWYQESSILSPQALGFSVGKCNHLKEIREWEEQAKHNQKGGLHMLSLYYLTDLVLDANDIQFMNLFVSP